MARRVNSKAATECINHNRRDFNKILLNDQHQQVIIVSSELRAKFAVYDCLVINCILLI